MKRSARQVILAVIIGLGLIPGVIGLLAGLEGRAGLGHAAYAAAGEVYCVTNQPPNGNLLIGCDQVFTIPQAAVDAASGGEEIRLATGVYTGIQDRAGLKQMVYLNRSVSLHGGYSSDFSKWDLESYPTILDAEGEGRVLFIAPGISTTIEGLTLRGGSATGLRSGFPFSTQNDYGGGVYVISATVTFSKTTIEGNIATDDPDRDGYGGGLYATGSAIILTGNTVRDNVASLLSGSGQGGGLAIISSTATLTGNLIVRNTAVRTNLNAEFFAVGGGLLIGDSMATLTGNQVMSNTAFFSTTISPSPSTAHGMGGGLGIYGSDATLNGNLIQGNVGLHDTPQGTYNRGYSFGGGLLLQDNERVLLSNNRIQGNVASRSAGDGYGGGVYGYLYDRPAGVFRLIGNTIQENVASLAGHGIGGGFLVLPGPPLSQTGAKISVRFDNNLVLSNTASFSTANSLNVGGGVVLASSQADLWNNRFQGNQALQTGGGLLLDQTRAALTNTVFLENHLFPHNGTYFNRGVGLMLEEKSEARLWHTTLARNEAGNDSGIALQGGSMVALTNTILANQTVGITATGGNTITLNAILWHDVPIPVSAALTDTVMLINQFTGDPAFASDGYHLGPGSAGIARGLPAGVPIDIDGHPRHPVPDLGADEYIGIRPTPRVYLPVMLKAD